VNIQQSNSSVIPSVVGYLVSSAPSTSNPANIAHRSPPPGIHADVRRAAGKETA
jgi:hypothetical protein